MIDKNVEAVRQKLLDRSNVGIVKYGCTTERDDLSLLDWLKHLQEEQLDSAVYLQAAISKLEMSILKILIGEDEYTPPEGGVLSSNKEVFEKDKRPFHRPRSVLVAEDDARWEKAFAGQYRDRDYLHVALGYKTRDGLNGSLQNKINRGVVARVYDIGRGGRGLKQVFRWVGK